MLLYYPCVILRVIRGHRQQLVLGMCGSSGASSSGASFGRGLSYQGVQLPSFFHFLAPSPQGNFNAMMAVHCFECNDTLDLQWNSAAEYFHVLDRHGFLHFLSVNPFAILEQP